MPARNDGKTERLPSRATLGPDEKAALMTKITTLEERLKKQGEKQAKDTEFYEEALEKRFQQMEKFQAKSD